MGGMAKNYIQFDGDSPESQRTIDFRLTEDQPKLANQYNISVFNADLTPATGTVQGMVSAMFYSPGADRPEESANTADLSTGCRKFNLFFATIDRAVFSVTGLMSGQIVAIEAIRSNPNGG